jgi:hypothetical protein
MQKLSNEYGYGKRANPRRMQNMDIIQFEIDQKLHRLAQLAFFKYYETQISKKLLIRSKFFSLFNI